MTRSRGRDAKNSTLKEAREVRVRGPLPQQRQNKPIIYFYNSISQTTSVSAGIGSSFCQAAITMARLNNEILCGSDDEEFPDLSTILKRSVKVLAEKEQGEGSGGTAKKDKEQGKKSIQHGIIRSPRSVTKLSCDEKQLRKQRPLGFAHVNSLRLPIAKEALQKKFNRDQYLESRHDERKLSTPRRAAKDRVDHRTFVSSTISEDCSEDDISFDDLSDFIVDDSASDVEDRPLRTQKPRREVVPAEEKVRSIVKPTVIDLTSPKKSFKSSNVKLMSQRSEASETVFDENPEACLRLYALYHTIE